MVVREEVRRGEVYLVNLDPTLGGEIHKTRPCLIISPDELNSHLRTYIVAPLTTGGHPYPFRIPCEVGGKAGFIVLDQLRTIDRARLVRRLDRVSAEVLAQVLAALQEMFAP